MTPAGDAAVEAAECRQCRHAPCQEPASRVGRGAGRSRGGRRSRARPAGAMSRRFNVLGRDEEAPGGGVGRVRRSGFSSSISKDTLRGQKHATLNVRTREMGERVALCGGSTRGSNLRGSLVCHSMLTWLALGQHAIRRGLLVALSAAARRRLRSKKASTAGPTADQSRS